MGMRATFTVNVDQHSSICFYAQWGSPQFKVAALADFLTDCAATGVLPCGEAYERYASHHTEGDHFRERISPHAYPATDHGDLDFRYALTVSGDPEDWSARLAITTVLSADTLGEVQTLEVTSDDTRPILHAAADGLRQMAATIQARGGRCGPWTAQEFTDEAARYEARAGLHEAAS